MPGTLQAGHDGLRCAHPDRDIGLGRTSRQTCVDLFAHDGEDGAKAAILGLDLGIAQQRSAEFHETGNDGPPKLPC